ncbi:MAG: 16S rRNA (guanine(527)-N(7))-methyltransferase RsmG [Planctomycetes bacterium SCN 63-9]|nr:MAG: 16S rRNA (guanine(527)-N(7))-methyltransferase RsmG [Planctomycetes bacterium SCN 63-9]
MRDSLVKPGLPLLDSILGQCGITLSAPQLDLLWRYHQMLRQANAELNLTRIHNFENMVLKHYVDSLIVLKFLSLPSPLIDMGSGPGLPGIPLKIACPDVRMVLAEPRGARVDFLQTVIDSLGLKEIEVYGHKLGADYPEKVAGVISRAVASIPETLDRVAGSLDPGGRMIFMKGPECDEEIEEAQTTHERSFRLTDDHAYEIPGTSHRRRLVIYERLEGEPTDRPGRRKQPVSDLEPSREITSDSNPVFRTCHDLLSGRGIRKHGQAILAGPRIIEEILEKFPDRAIGWLTGSRGTPPPSRSLEWFRFTDSLFHQLDVAGTKAPLLLVQTPEIQEWSADSHWPDGCTLFVPFQDPENVGAVIRSAAAFRVARIVLLQEAAHPFHPRSSRAAGPALFQVPLFRGPSLSDLGRQKLDVPLIALDTDGPELNDQPFPSRFGLVVGLEGPGLPDHLRGAERRRIDINPEVESLNAATAVAIALYSWSRQARTTPVI